MPLCYTTAPRSLYMVLVYGGVRYNNIPKISVLESILVCWYDIFSNTGIWKFLIYRNAETLTQQNHVVTFQKAAVPIILKCNFSNIPIPEISYTKYPYWHTQLKISSIALIRIFCISTAYFSSMFSSFLTFPTVSMSS